MVSHQAAPASMYCRKCGYQLVGLSESRCPECGRPFDPADLSTFLVRPYQWRRRRRIRLAASVLGALLLSIAISTTFLYWGWRREQPILATVRAIPGGWVKTRPVGPAWLIRWTPRRLAWLFERADDVGTYPAPCTDAMLQSLTPLSHLQKLAVGGRGISNAGLQHLKAWPQLQWLTLSDSSITDAGLANLKYVPNLQRLDLCRTRIGDAGLTHVAQLKKLEWIHLAETQITGAGFVHLGGLTRMHTIIAWQTKLDDEGLKHIQGLTRMMDLLIWDTRVTDASLQYLVNMKRLDTLEAYNTGVTAAGTAKLKQALPKVHASP